MSKNYKILMLASLCNGISFSMILPLLAPLVRQLHLTEFQGGLLVSSGALMMCIAAIWISKRSETQNIYKLLSFGFVGMTITWGMFSAVLSYGVSFQIRLGLLFLLLIITRASTGIFMAMPQIALQSYVMTYFTSEQQRSKTMSAFGALNSAGLILGPLLTALLIVQGILVPLWLAMILLACVSILIIFKFNQFEQKPEIAEKTQIDHLKKAAGTQHESVHLDGYQADQQKDSMSFKVNSKIIFWLMVGLSLFLAVVTLNLTAGFYIQDKFVLPIQQSAIYFSQCSLIAGVALVCMQITISKWLKWSLNRLFIVGAINMILGVLICVLAQRVQVFQAAYFFLGIAIACLSPVFTTGAAQSVALQWQTRIAALCTIVQSLSLVIAPLLSTAIYQIDIAYPFYFLLGLFTLLLLYFAYMQSSNYLKSDSVS